jgi:hypothetical protein
MEEVIYEIQRSLIFIHWYTYSCNDLLLFRELRRCLVISSQMRICIKKVCLSADRKAPRGEAYRYRTEERDSFFLCRYEVDCRVVIAQA